MADAAVPCVQRRVEAGFPLSLGGGGAGHLSGAGPLGKSVAIITTFF
jgi:hypothetical protein